MSRAGRFRFAAVVAAACCGVAFLGAATARAANCPGNPGALGTSRTLVIAPADYGLIGSMQYKRTLPLADKEVVITFDDGPLQPYSGRVLDLLTAQCVKATYFIVGQMARAYPDVVRREYQSGYTIGTHSQNHPTHFERLSSTRLAEQIDGGIGAVGTALGDADHVAPFFRIPGLARSRSVEQALAARSLIVFGADVVADDWFHRITPAQIVQRAMSRLERRGSGILLLHDIHPATVAALPALLRELKEHGFHVVHVVPSAPAVEVASKMAAWKVASALPDLALSDEAKAAPRWPLTEPVPIAASDEVVLAIPATASFDVDEETFAQQHGADADWPPPMEVELAGLRRPDVGIARPVQTIAGPARAEPRKTAVREEPRHDHLRAHLRSRPSALKPGEHAGFVSSPGSFAALFTPAHWTRGADRVAR